MTQNTAVSTDTVTRDVRRAELAAVTFKPNGQMFQPKDGRELMDMANLMATAGPMVKDIYRSNAGACKGNGQREPAADGGQPCPAGRQPLPVNRCRDFTGLRSGPGFGKCGWSRRVAHQ